MAFSDSSFPYGPFVPHWIPKQHVQEHFARNRTDSLLALNTTVESMLKVGERERWVLTLRRHDPTRQLDQWWKEEFDAVVLCNGHYTVPFVPHVDGLAEYMNRYPGKVLHSKSYRTAGTFARKQVLIVGNSASGMDIASALVSKVQLPVYQSRRSRSPWDGDEPPDGVAWKPVIASYCTKTGDINFADGSVFGSADIDHVIYCTGYKSSFPFWNSNVNGGPLWDYAANRLVGSYLHTFFRDHSTLGIIGMPRTLTFRSFEYQAIALARVFAGRNKLQLPEQAEMKRWEDERAESTKRQNKKFHDIPWINGETMDYLKALYEIAGLPKLGGEGLCPPILDAETRWAIEHVRKYPEPAKDSRKTDRTLSSRESVGHDESQWVVVEAHGRADSLHFI
ncbi:hypothetical protein LTR36_001832 [Oleoguttula mirabilis]|uniref:Flavin-containing monooxygenase n=1 Tax=Oleoguttula mirabilis TaxID=1507867 RepID=A0AAV9JM70_9PEZI|nr:hypothetical protein LTR36_001832 [Oleoguttula mirabilis]